MLITQHKIFNFPIKNTFMNREPSFLTIRVRIKSVTEDVVLLCFFVLIVVFFRDHTQMWTFLNDTSDRMASQVTLVHDLPIAICFRSTINFLCIEKGKTIVPKVRVIFGERELDL